MFKLLNQVLRDAFTGIDGVSWDALKIVGYPSCAMAVTIYLANSVYLTFTKETFDYISFGAGFATLMGGLLAVAAGVAVKSDTEPKELK